MQNNCGNFFNLDSRFAKAGRRLGPVYMEVGVPGQASELTLLGRVTRLSIQSINGHPHLSYKLDQIKMRDYSDRWVTHLHVNRSLNCVIEVVQCICIIISDQPLLLMGSFVFPFYYYYFLVKKRTPLFSNPIEVNYLVTVYK